MEVNDETYECCNGCYYGLGNLDLSTGEETLICVKSFLEQKVGRTSICPDFIPDEELKDCENDFEVKMIEKMREPEQLIFIPDEVSKLLKSENYNKNYITNRDIVYRLIIRELQKEIAIDRIKAKRAGYKNYSDWEEALLNSKYDRLVIKISSFCNILELFPIDICKMISPLTEKRLNKYLESKEKSNSQKIMSIRKD